MEAAKDPGASLEVLGRRAGLKGKYIKQNAHQMLKRPSPAKTQLGKIMEEHTILNTQSLIEKLAEGLGSYHLSRGYDGSEKKVPDFPTRCHYLTLIFRLKGELNPEIQNVTNIMNQLTDSQLALIISDKATPYDFLGENAQQSQ